MADEQYLLFQTHKVWVPLYTMVVMLITHSILSNTPLDCLYLFRGWLSSL